MRMNYWLGGGYTAHVPREILEKNDNTINTPILPTLSNYDKFKWLYKYIDEKQSVIPALKLIFYSTDKEEFNIGTHNLRLDDGDFFFKYCLPHTPSGSRFWFFKLKTVELYLEEYEDSLKNVTMTDWMEVKRLENPKLATASRERMAELMLERLDKVADRYGAGEWKPFTPNDYFDNGDLSETPLLYRLYTKP